MNFIGAKALLAMQSEPGKLIRHYRRPIFFPWRPTPPARPETGKVLFVSTASDLYWWRKEDRELLEELNAPVRLMQPGTMTQQQLLALSPSVDCYWFDIWCGDEAVRRQLLEALLPAMPTINDYVI